MKNQKIVLALLTALLLLSCSTTVSVTRSTQSVPLWIDPLAEQPAKLLLVPMKGEDKLDIAIGHELTQQLGAGLDSSGYYNVVTISDSIALPDRFDARELSRLNLGTGADYIIVGKVNNALSDDQEVKFSWFRYSSWTQREVYSTFHLDIALYRLSDGEIIWSHSQTYRDTYTYGAGGNMLRVGSTSSRKDIGSAISDAVMQEYVARIARELQCEMVPNKKLIRENYEVKRSGDSTLVNEWVQTYVFVPPDSLR